MDKKIFFQTAASLGFLLSLLPMNVRANFIIEFTDGRTVTVGRYVEEGQTIKIYNDLGAIGFRKADVRRITEVGKNSSASLKLEMMATKRSSSPNSMSSEAEKAAGEEEGAVEKKSKKAEALRQQRENEYAGVTDQSRSLFKKANDDIKSGAPKEVIAENNRQLEALNQRRYDLMRDARQESDPEKIPSWAQ